MTPKETALPEPWLRGPVPGVSPLVAPVLYSFQQAWEDLSQFTEGLTTKQIWERPFGLNPIGREMRHIAGSVDRLVTYLEGKQLEPAQIAAIQTEMEPGASRDELLSEIQRSFQRAESVVRAIDPAKLAEPRAVGRKKLPTTAIGLLTHIAEHTQRHTGQAVRASRLVRAMGEAV